MRYRLFATKGIWNYYHQDGAMTYGPSGTVFNAGCRPKYGALRTTPAGSKLRAEFNIWNPGRDAGETGLFWTEGMVRGYLLQA